MRNKIEILRAIEFTKDDLKDITNLDEITMFSDKDKEFIEEFKKIYELGVNQLEKFINKLDSEGSELDEYSIQYYTHQLFNGPLSQYTAQLSKDKKYFSNIPDILGRCGNVESTSSNISMIRSSQTPTGQHIDVFNKIPNFLQTLAYDAANITEDIFRIGMQSTILVEKDPQKRSDTEDSGSWQTTSHGTYCVRDRAFYNVLKNSNTQIFDKVKSKIGDENYRIFYDRKNINPFSAAQNTSNSGNFVLKISLSGQAIETDILGNIFDSFERRESVLKVENETNHVEYSLNTNTGQLGIQK